MTPKAKICLIITVLLLAVGIGAIFALRHFSKKGHIAHIYQDGQCIRTIDLSQVTEPFEFTVTTKQGGSNTIRVLPGSIGVIDATCPDKICVHTGYISSSLSPITCLPNHLVIEISGREPPDLDGIVS